MKVSALLVAAGFGSRLGAQLPKALVEIQGVALVARSARVLATSAHITSMVVVIPAGYEARVRERLEQAGSWPFSLQLVPGGAERQDSVRAGLAATGDADLILIHDAARPFVEPETIEAAINTALQHGAAVVGIPASDTIKDVDDDGWITATPLRTRMWQVQTPQVFRADLIRAAHERALADRVVATDDSALVERVGVRVRMVRGTPENRKITTPEDLRWAEWYLATQAAPR